MNVQILCWEEVLTGKRGLRGFQTEASQEENERQLLPLMRGKGKSGRQAGGGPGTLEDRLHPLPAPPSSGWLQTPEVCSVSHRGAQCRIPTSQTSVKGCRVTARRKTLPGGSSFLAKRRTNWGRSQRAARHPPDSATVTAQPCSAGTLPEAWLQVRPPSKEPFWCSGSKCLWRVSCTDHLSSCYREDLVPSREWFYPFF